jgi:SecA DEAD-like domain
LTYLFDTNTLDFADCAAIIELTKTFKTSRFAIVEFLKALKDLKPILNELKDFPEILQIMAMSYATTISAKREQGLNDVLKLVKNLKKLNNNSFLENLNKLFQSFCFDLPCLSTNLQDFVKSPPPKNFNDLKILLEQSPFGKRDLKTQFNVTEVERVVNGFLDLNHQSMYQYYYRKKLMESFLFINRAGLDLPIYNNKPAKDLENKDLKELFQNVKKKQPAHLDDFQRRLYALGLLREIMYRTTGQFPYSTQMLSLIDCMMHQGDVISNIDTGQGKSLTDMMKVALLWLESDRVDLSTSSLIDAKRDLEFYDNYLKFLGIPHSSSPLTTSDLEKNFIPNGLNVSTLAQFSLVDSMAKVNNLKLKESVDKVSLVLNESDDAILDDRTVYRYATTDDSVALTQKQEWVYEAINDFVYTIPFVLDNTSQQEDIENLRQYLLQEAQKRKVSSRFIHEKLIDSQLLQWIESAILVNYRLRENFDYVVTETPMMKKVRGKECETYAIKILQKDGKLSSNNQYGNGIQQLLYAKLNKACGKQKFIIEPESKTIISSNNKNRIDYYRSKNGLIWGSSGTVGFGGEIDLQYHKFGFEFSKVAPHQAKQVKEYQPSILINEKEQFAAILKQIKTNLKSNKTRPNFLFFKDIETAKRFKQYLTEMDKNVEHQLFTGLGQEEEVIKKAAEPGMLTISTQALGRNTDVKYPKEGMNLIDTFVSQERNRIQRIGRTGRQGSKGRIHSIYNQEDFKGMSIAELKNSIEKVESQEREYNEDLFDIIGYLLSHVNKHSGDSRFFIDKWSSFSQSIEKSYHIEKSNQTYDKDSFMEKICEEFNSLITNTEIPTVIFKDFQSKLKEKHEKRPGYASYQKEIKLVDCVPAEWIAYQFVNSNANQGSEEHNNQASIAKFKALFHSIHPKKIENLNQDYLIKDAVKAKLKVLFHSIHQKNFETLNQDYLQYVNFTNLQTIKEAHQEFLQEYLQEQVKSSKHLSFVKRWMGFEGHLNRITQDSIYLFFFKAMVDVGQEPMAFDKVKPALETLLEEYTQYYWFVNKNRKQEVANLIEKIKEANNYEELVNILIISKCSMMDIDLEKNLSSWRRIKPLHFFGRSRFQSVLDRALTLASTMGQQKITSEQIHQMFKKLTNKDNANELSIDELKNIIKTLETTDRANASVICKSIESAIKNNELKQNPNGMTGRIKPKNSS